MSGGSEGGRSPLAPLARALGARAAFSLGVAFAVLAPLLVHWVAGRTLVWFDTARLYAPERWMADEALRAFRLPLWNPFLAGGMPFLADAIHGVLHPVSIVTAWLGTGRSADLLVGGHVALAGLGAALLARELGASREGAAVAGFTYGMSGFVLSMAGNLVFLAGAGSLPFCVAGLRRFAKEPGPGSVAAGAAGAALLAFTGDAQAMTVGGALALALAWEAGGWRGAARAVAAGGVGILVAGVQLVPSAVNLPRTLRGAETWSPAASVWAFEPWRIPELALPGLLRGKDPLMDPVFGGLAGPGRWPAGNLPVPFAASVFVGLLPLTLAVAGAGEGRRGRLLGVAALVLLWAALGPALGASAVLGQVPLWKAFRYSEKMVGPLTLAVAALAGLGLDRVAGRRVAWSKVLASATALGLASVVVCHLEVSRLAPALLPDAEARVVRGAWHVLGALAALGGWLLARGRLGGAGRGALAAAVWIAMAAASPAALRPGDADARLRSPGPTLAANGPGPRILTPYTYEPLSTGPGMDWIDQASREHASRGYPAYNARTRLDSIEDYGAMMSWRLATLKGMLGARWPQAARRYAVTHVVLDPPRAAEHLRLHDVAVSGGVRVDPRGAPPEVWAVPHRDWASFASEVRLVEDERAAVAATARAAAEGSPAVVVEAPSRFEAGAGRVLSVARGLESLVVEAESDAPATLVVADAWWPGWEATIDGQPAPIFRADALVRAVRWPAGRHVLTMRYRPPEVRTGIALSLLGLAALAAWAALLRRARPR